MIWYLQESNFSPDFKCPECGQGFDVDEWTTEYGDPIDGVYDVNCNCGKKFLVSVSVGVKYKVLED